MNLFSVTACHINRWRGRTALTFLVMLLCWSCAHALANARVPFIRVAIAEVRLFSFMVATGQMIPEPARTVRDVGDGTVETKTFGFPLDRHFVIGLRFAIEPGQSSGYRLPDADAVRVRVDGRERYVWHDFYLHGRTYDTKGVLSKTASAWKFVTLDLVCDPVDVDVMHRERRLKRIRVNGRCPE